MQSFLQRCQNYVQKIIIEQIPMRLTRANQRQFMRESGLRVRTYEQGYSTAVAAIFAADWALEYPHPVSPKVHVSLPTLWDNLALTLNPLPENRASYTTSVKPVNASLPTILSLSQAPHSSILCIHCCSAPLSQLVDTDLPLYKLQEVCMARKPLPWS